MKEKSYKIPEGEVKKKLTLTVSPTVTKNSKKKAKKDNKSISEMVENFLYDYSAE